MPDLSRRMVYTIDGMGRARITRSTPYKQEDGDTLLMDVYVPDGLVGEARAPAIVLVHGGPIPREMPAPTTWGLFQSYGELLAASGVVGVVINHRLHAITEYPRAERDLRDAVARLRDHAETWNVDPERIGLWAFSGGGPLLSWALPEHPAYLRAVAAFYPLLDLRAWVPPGAGDDLREAAEAMSPSAQLRIAEKILPVFIARAGLDSELINGTIDRFVHEALAANAPLTLMNHPAGEHTFDVLNDDARSHEIVREALAFFRAHLG